MTEPGAQELDAAGVDLLLQHFSGKRSAERVPASYDVVLHGGGEPVRARLWDVSEGGAQVELLDEWFVSAAAEGRAVDCLVLAQQAFAGPVRLMLPGSPEGTPGIDVEIVRITVGQDPKDGVRAGCRFHRPLNAEERVRLGLDMPAGSGTPRVPRRGTSPFVLLFATSGTTAGPLCAARVQTIDGRRMVARIEGAADAELLSGRLRGRLLRLALLRRGGKVWDVGARAVAVRVEDGVATIDVATDEEPAKTALADFRAV